MLASELIDKLRVLITDRGDATMKYLDRDEHDINWIEVDDEFYGGDKYADPECTKNFYMGE